MDNNRHDHWITSIEANLAKVTGLNVLSNFDLDKWQDYKFPFAFAELIPEDLIYPYEDFLNFEGNQNFIIWVGVNTTLGGDLRKVTSALTAQIEKAFRNWKIDSLTTSDFVLHGQRARINRVVPVSNIGATKYLFIIEGEIVYNQDWILDYHLQ